MWKLDMALDHQINNSLIWTFEHLAGIIYMCLATVQIMFDLSTYQGWHHSKENKLHDTWRNFQYSIKPTVPCQQIIFIT